MGFGIGFGGGGLSGGAGGGAAVASPRTRLVLKQAGATLLGPNEYNSMATLAAAMAGVRGGGRVVLDPSHLGGGAGFDLDASADWKYWELAIENVVPGTGAFIRARVPDGVTMTKFRKLWGPVQLEFTGTGAAPISDVADGEEFVLEGGATFAESGGAPLIDMSSFSGICQFRLRDLATLGGQGPAGDTPITAGASAILILLLGGIVQASALGGSATVFYIPQTASGQVRTPQSTGAVISSLVQTPTQTIGGLRSGTYAPFFGAFDRINAASPVTLNLPDQNGFDQGKEIAGQIETGASTVTLTATGGDTINGGATVPVTGVGMRYSCIADGLGNWLAKVW